MVAMAVVAQVRQAWVPTLTGYLLLALIGGVLGAGAQLPRLARETTERNQGRHR